ncbi:MAG: methionyl-tRNA formyltransferase [Rickettsiales bacterium]|nr:methionyl-tRNA formyltransferase [Rickettsiales bacterium]
MRVIFMGTPEFSIPALEKLIDNNNFDIAACYTSPPSIANRGQKITKSPIHQLAQKHNIKVITPKTLRDKETQAELRDLKPDVIIVVAYGLILPKEVLEIPKYGCINIHPSLLPRWRGAAPIQRPIMAGDKETGVAIIKMDEGLDSGDIINVKKITIKDSDDYIDISSNLSKIGSELLIISLNEIKEGTANYVKQDDKLASYAKKLTKQECHIDWQESARDIYNKIKGLRGTLTAYFEYKGEKIKIHTATIIDDSQINDEIGFVNNDFEIQCAKGIIKPEIVQRPGKKAMSLKEFMLGLH